MWKDNKAFTSSLEKCYYVLWTHNGLKLNYPNDYCVYSQDVNWWTGVTWITGKVLISFWTLILTAPIHCKDSIGEQVI